MLNHQTIDGLYALDLPAMAAGLVEQADSPATRRSASRSASACSSTESSPSARTAAWSAISRRPSCAATPSSRTSTSAAAGAWSAQLLVAGRGRLGRGPPRRGHRRARPGSARPTWPARWPTPPSAEGTAPSTCAAPRLLDELAIARVDGRLARLAAPGRASMSSLIDDFLLRPLTPDQAADLLEVIEDRAGLRSTIITSQLPIASWHEAIGEPTLADAVLDRIFQNLHRIELTGESMRRTKPTETLEKSQP